VGVGEGIAVFVGGGLVSVGGGSQWAVKPLPALTGLSTTTVNDGGE
jgi:hypothetical protein